MEEYWITADSFGPDLPANWEEIAEYLNVQIASFGIAHDDNEVNELWEDYWQGKFPDAPVPEE